MRNSLYARRDKLRVYFAWSQSSWTRFLCLHLTLFILSVLSWAITWTRSGHPFYILVSGAPKSLPLLLLGLPLGPCTSLTASAFTVPWAPRITTEGRGKTRSFFSVPAFTCLLSLQVKPISTTAAQHKGA